MNCNEIRRICDLVFQQGLEAFIYVYQSLFSFFFTILQSQASSWLTDISCYWISEILAFTSTSLLFLYAIVYILRGIGILLSGVIDMTFNKATGGVVSLVHFFISRIFLSIGWIFSTIGNILKRTLFGK